MAFLLFDDNRVSPARGLVFPPSEAMITARDPEAVAPALAQVAQAQAQGRWLAGYLAYELGHALEPRLRPLLRPSPQPMLRLAVCGPPVPLRGAEIAAALGPEGHAEAMVTALEPEWDAARYATAFDAVRALIAAGDVYQINLTCPFAVGLSGPARALFARLRRAARAGHGAFLDFGDEQILSVSPELFFAIDAEGRIRTRPMKGTVPRGLDLAEDAQARAALAGDAKQRAENLMIVDLLRNDLSRIAAPGSVAVDDLFTVETYPSLHTMTSGISARLQAGTGFGDILCALFPCGSVTGAPKIRAMECIHALEAEPRGVYCGAIGWLAPDGQARFSVAIRTLTIRDGAARWHAGGGLVADSTCASEYRETLLKTRVLTADPRPFALIETLRWSPEAGYWLLPGHLARLAASASYFDRPCDAAAVAQALAAHAAGLPPSPHLVRLALSETGHVALTSACLPPAPFAGLRPERWPAAARPWRVGLAATPVPPGDPFFRHKTSRRALYDTAGAAAAAQGLDEVLFLNTAGRLAEGSRTTLFLERAGRFLTPPLSEGALPGVLRAALIAAGDPPVVEAPIAPEDLGTGRLWLGNAVRGLVPAELAFAGARAESDQVAS